MTDSKRQRIVDALEARLKTILAGEVYETDMGANVFVWRDSPLIDAELDGINFRDYDEPAIITFGAMEHRLHIEFEMQIMATDEEIAACGGQSGKAAGIHMRKAMADFQTAIKVDETFGGLVGQVLPAERDFFKIVLNDGKYMGAQIRLIFKYETARWSAE